MITIKLYLHVDDELHTCRVRPFPRKRAPKTVAPILTDNQLRLFQWLMWDFKATNAPYEIPTMGGGKWVESLQQILTERLTSTQERGGIANYQITRSGPYSFRVVVRLRNEQNRKPDPKGDRVR